VVAAIRGYVERDYTHATLKGAARVVHMNPQYVSRLFKERAGDT
jgi:methylphosphotriester-DNA--protein-cysteine methyltransferase